MNLLKISIIFSITGILLLLFLANFLEPKLIKIEEINDKTLNRKVKIQGSILKIQDKETFQILSVKDDSGAIDVLCNCHAEENQNIIVIGRVKEYRDSLQIQADKILEKDLP